MIHWRRGEWNSLRLDEADLIKASNSNGRFFLDFRGEVTSKAQDALPRDTRLVLSPEMEENFLQSTRVLGELIRHPNTVMLLVKYRVPPLSGFRDDGLVESFVCTGSAYDFYETRVGKLPYHAQCGAMVSAVFNGDIKSARVVVRQLPKEDEDSADPAYQGDVAAIVPHRGDPHHLKVCLKSLLTQDGAMRAMPRVGLDLLPLPVYKELASEMPNVAFYDVSDPPAGPYLIRQHLIEEARGTYFLLQDSDDCSCSDRVRRQVHHLEIHGADIVGSHEIRFDEESNSLHAFRYPLDANLALSYRISESLLQGAALMKRASFLSIGGLSTDQIIASDTQFMLRAFFSLRMQNVDGFLYLRRTHSRSLTNAAETKFGSPLRERLRKSWELAFAQVGARAITLDESALAARQSNVEHSFTRLQLQTEGA